MSLEDEARVRSVRPGATCHSIHAHHRAPWKFAVTDAGETIGLGTTPYMAWADALLYLFGEKCNARRNA